MRSFYTCRSQKCKKDGQFDCIFFTFGIWAHKIARKMLVKLTIGCKKFLREYKFKRFKDFFKLIIIY